MKYFLILQKECTFAIKNKKHLSINKLLLTWKLHILNIWALQ